MPSKAFALRDLSEDLPHASPGWAGIRSRRRASLWCNDASPINRSAFMSRAVETIGPEATQEPDLFRRSMLIGAASALADTGLGSLWSTAVGQPAEQAP